MGMEVFDMTLQNCKPKVDWFGLATGFAMFSIGVFFTMTFVGAVIGIPMLLASLGLLTDHTTLRGTPCAG